MIKKGALHALILVLAIVSIFCVTQVAYIEANNESKEYWENHYRDVYSGLVVEALTQAKVQLLEKYGEDVPQEYGYGNSEDYWVDDEDFIYYTKLNDGKNSIVNANVDDYAVVKSYAGGENYVEYSPEEKCFLGDDYIVSRINYLISELGLENEIEYARFIVDGSYDDYGSLSYSMSRMKAAPTKAEVKINEKKEANYIIVSVLAIVISIIPFIILMVLAGRKKRYDEAETCWFDRVWLDVFAGIVIIAAGTALSCIVDLFDNYREAFVLMVIVTGVVFVEAVIISCESFARRIKTQSLVKTTLIGVVCKKISNFIKKTIAWTKKGIKAAFENLGLTAKLIVGVAAIVFWIFIIFIWCNITWMDDFFDFVILVWLAAAPIIAGCVAVWNYFDELETIVDDTKMISEDNIYHKIERKMIFPSNKNLKNQINNIGNGLNTAVEESMKNERMRTELIANVSHDLKTPLTSIINYVNLLKMEGVNSENAEKYLDILDQKSARLKNLTEDLVEVSKLNSGVVSLNRERLDIVQLINQSLGEFEEKLNQKNIQVVKTIEEQPIWVMADGRKTWRAFDNLYSNIYKYAMSGTRAYIDVKRENGKVVIFVKNISESPLNFSSDEIFERFVRGDGSRTTEGNGLGLSIAKSIVEKQGGKIEIYLDGDLFKVEIIMDTIE